MYFLTLHQEAVHEAEGVAVSLEQSRKKEQTLKEEGRRLAEERADALRLVKELQGEEQTVGGEEDKSMRFISHWKHTNNYANVICFF